VRKSLKCILGAAVLAASTGADAAWYAAKSKHFVIYADANPKRLQQFAAKLERFDQAGRAGIGMTDPPVGDGNRLTVFVVPSAADVRSIVGDKSGFFDGFYTGRVTGSLAYVPKEAVDSSDEGSDAIFFHEYTHHLMAQDLTRPYPEWFVEGFAEFYSTPKFASDGSVSFGNAVQGRAWGLFAGPKMPVQSLFAGLADKTTNAQRDVFYGRGWLLTHYLLMDPSRKGQMTKFVAAIERGESQVDAGQEAFGDLAQLDKDLNRYLEKPLWGFRVPAANIHVGQIDVTPLSAGGAAVILTRARIKYHAADNSDEALAGTVRAIESRFPGDELVETTLAEAELNAGHADAALAAATKAVAASPADTEALVLKGRAVEAQAKDAEGDARISLYEQARDTFIAANKLDTEDPEPLFEYYMTYMHEGRRPNDNAIAALHYASDLAPQDLNVRMNSAIAYLNEGNPKDARATLAVVAYSPHAAEAGDVAKRMMADIDAGDSKAALMELRHRSTAGAGSH
jgi:tetratricopeptide (TPR) repeat protein